MCAIIAWTFASQSVVRMQILCYYIKNTFKGDGHGGFLQKDLRRAPCRFRSDAEYDDKAADVLAKMKIK